MHCAARKFELQALDEESRDYWVLSLEKLREKIKQDAIEEQHSEEDDSIVSELEKKGEEKKKEKNWKNMRHSLLQGVVVRQETIHV